MSWVFVGGGLVVVLNQYNLIFRRTGPGLTRGLIVLDALALFVAPIALAIWLGFELHWYALILLLAFLVPVGVRTDPAILLSVRWPMGLLLVLGVAALWTYAWPI